MRVPGKSPRIVTEAPPRDPSQAIAMAVFHRIKHTSRVLAFIVIVIGFCVSLCLLLFGSVGLADGEFIEMGIVITLFGLGVLAVCIKGAWGLTKGPVIHVITFEPDRVVWGYVGKEQALEASEIQSIDWRITTDNDLTLSVRTRAGKRITFHYIDRLVHRKQRAELLAHLKICYPDAAFSESDDS